MKIRFYKRKEFFILASINWILDLLIAREEFRNNSNFKFLFNNPQNNNQYENQRKSKTGTPNDLVPIIQNR